MKMVQVEFAVESEVETRLHPCAIESLSIEFANDDNVCKSVVAVGCYELDESSQHRDGSIALYEVSFHENDLSTATGLLAKNEISCPAGILDLKLSKDYLYAALASETLQLYPTQQVLFESQPQPSLSITREGEGLFLSVDVQRNSHADHRMVVSTQSSSLLVFQQSESQLEEVAHVPQAHVMFGENMPAWTVAFDIHHEQQLVSGGDDCAFRVWDLRAPQRAAAVSKHHTAGVTSFQFHEDHENLLISGSYDESFALWDVRSVRSPLTSVETGGGVWRLKWIPNRSSKCSFNQRRQYLASANMQHGCQVQALDLLTLEHCRILSDPSPVHFTDSSEKHLSYGLDVLYGQISSAGPEEEEIMSALMLSSSFYDNRLSLWKAHMSSI